MATQKTAPTAIISLNHNNSFILTNSNYITINSIEISIGNAEQHQP